MYQMMLYDFMGVWGHTLHTLWTSMHRQQNNVISFLSGTAQMLFAVNVKITFNIILSCVSIFILLPKIRIWQYRPSVSLSVRHSKYCVKTTRFIVEICSPRIVQYHFSVLYAYENRTRSPLTGASDSLHVWKVCDKLLYIAKGVGLS